MRGGGVVVFVKNKYPQDKRKKTQAEITMLRLVESATGAVNIYHIHYLAMGRALAGCHSIDHSHGQNEKCQLTIFDVEFNIG